MSSNNITSHEESFDRNEANSSEVSTMDAYFSADVETDGPIPGPYSLLSFALVYAGSYDGITFQRPDKYKDIFYCELKPISLLFEEEALAVNGLDRNKLMVDGQNPVSAMCDAYNWIMRISGDRKPVLAAYPLSFDWSWLYWYFISYCRHGSPFEHSRCFDMKTAFAVKAARPISLSGRAKLPKSLMPLTKHTHHAIDDAVEQAEIFANIFEWERPNGSGG